MRFLAKTLAVVGLALGLSTSASALSVVLTQSGGSYAGSATASQTLSLDIDLVFTAGDIGTVVQVLDPSLDFSGIGGFTGGTETSFYLPGVLSGVATAFVTGDIGVPEANTADGWEIFSGSGLTVISAGTLHMGTASFHLNGTAGVIDSNAGIGYPTTFSGTAGPLAVNLGTFTINAAAVPEPTTVAMLGMGLLGLAVSGRRR